MKMKWTAMLLILALVLGLLVGCGTQTASAPETSEPQAESAAASVEEPQAEPAQEEPVAEEPEDDPGVPADAEEPEEIEAGPDYREPLTYPIGDGSTTFTILHNEPALGPMTGQMNMSTYGDFEALALGCETIGFSPEWYSLSAMNGDTQFNLVVASGDYPDVFTAIDRYYTGGFAKALEDEVIVTIEEEMMAENMPEYWNILEDDPELRRAVTNNEGEFVAWYSVFDRPLVNEGYWIRQDWLDKLGMDVPTTIDEVSDFAYAAKSEFDLPSVLLMCSDLATLLEGYNLGITVATGAGFAYHREGDSIVADVTSERYHSYVEQLHQWYVDGIVSPNFSELNSGNFSGDMERELGAGRTAICKTLVNSLDNLVTLVSDPGYALSPFVATVDGGNIHTGQGEKQFDSCSISGVCDSELYPLILGWMNYWYTEDGAMLAAYGIPGVDYDYDESGEIYYTDNIMNNEYGYPPMLFSRARCFSGASFGLMLQDRTWPFYTEAQTDAIDLWTASTDNEEAVPASMSLTIEESEILAQYAPDLATYISEEIPKFVTGSRDLATWDDFMTTVEGMHIEELTALYQAAYDRYFED